MVLSIIFQAVSDDDDDEIGDLNTNETTQDFSSKRRTILSRPFRPVQHTRARTQQMKGEEDFYDDDDDEESVCLGVRYYHFWREFKLVLSKNRCF